jgi:protein PhnA
MADNFYYDENWNLVEWTPPESKTPTLDVNGNELQNGDSIVAIKNLPVKWGIDIKKWDKFTNIALSDDSDLVSAKSKQNGKLFLKVEFFKKVG